MSCLYIYIYNLNCLYIYIYNINILIINITNKYHSYSGILLLQSIIVRLFPNHFHSVSPYVLSHIYPIYSIPYLFSIFHPSHILYVPNQSPLYISSHPPTPFHPTPSLLFSGSFYETQIPKHQLSLEDAFVVDSATIELGPTLAALNEVNETFSEVEINEPWLDAIELAIRNDYAIRYVM